MVSKVEYYAVTNHGRHKIAATTREDAEEYGKDMLEYPHCKIKRVDEVVTQTVWENDED